ncbi:MAG TPA: ABC transporter permease [Clostridiaceae bacterium]|nr:ABC transporter permease [Clostridiaceae bacterium]
MLLGKYGIGIVLLFLMLIIGILEPSFRTGTNFLNVATQVSINGLISFGMCLVITTGGIDLSVGAQLALVSCVLGQLITKQGMNALLAIIIAVLVSTFLGFLNGILISRFHMFPFVVTLSSQLIIRGLAQIISGGQSIPLQSTFITDVYNMKLLGIPFPILYLTVATVAAYLILHWTKLGRYIFAVGGNENAAIASGVNHYWVKTTVYMISGLMAGLAGVIMAAKTGSAQSNIGVGYETDAIAACVIGGTSFAGGEATIPGVLMGIFIIGFIYNGMNLIGIQSYFQPMTKGMVIILAVLMDMFMKRKNA